LEGRAARVSPAGNGKDDRYVIEVVVQEESRRPLRHISSLSFAAVRPGADERPATGQAASGPSADEDEYVSRTLDDLLSALILPPEDGTAPTREHLSGLLARVRIPTLC